MHKTIDFSDFVNAFDAMDRRDNFSLYGLRALFEYIEDLEGDTGESVELDVIALCCEYSEESPVEVSSNYNLEIEDTVGMDEDDYAEAVIEELEDSTWAVLLENGKILYQDF